MLLESAPFGSDGRSSCHAAGIKGTDRDPPGIASRSRRNGPSLPADGYASGITEYEDLLLSQKTELELKASYLQSLFLFQMTKAEIEFISGNP